VEHLHAGDEPRVCVRGEQEISRREVGVVVHVAGEQLAHAEGVLEQVEHRLAVVVPHLAELQSRAT